MASRIERELAFLLTGKDISATKAMRGVRKEVDGLGKIGGKAGTNIARNLERGLVVGGVAAVGALGYAVNQAMSRESAIAGIAKTIDGEVTGIVKGLEELERRTPTSFVELAAIAEQAGALGIAKDDIVGFTETVAMLAETTDVSGEQGAASLGHLGVTLDLTGDKVGRFGNALVHLGNNGASTESQILGMAENISGAAGILNLSQADVLGWASAVANTGEEVEAGGSSIQRFMLETFRIVNAGGKDLQTLARISGKSTRQFRQDFQRNASGTLADFLVQLGELDEAKQAATLEDLGFTDIRITRALLKLLANTGKFTEALDDANKGWEENNAMTKEAAVRYGTTASQVATLRNNFDQAAAVIGTEVLPVIRDLAAEGVDWIQEHQPEIRQFAKDVGQGIRDAVDAARELDWEAIGSGLEAAGSAARTIAEAFLGLPDWVKTAVLTGWGLNKLTGGAVMDLGKLVFQRGLHPGAPMYVWQVNPAAGGLGGVGGKGAPLMAGPLGGLARFGMLLGGGALLANAPNVADNTLGNLGANTSGLGLLAAGFGLGPLGIIGGLLGGGVLSMGQAVSAEAGNQARGITSAVDARILDSPPIDELQHMLAGVNTGIAELNSNPIMAILAGEALTELEAQRAALQAALDEARASKRIAYDASQAAEGDREAMRRELDELPAAVGKYIADLNSSWSTRFSGMEAAFRSIKIPPPIVTLSVTNQITPYTVTRTTARMNAAGRATAV